ncbi:30S ribosomal protein S5, chloroplastic, partial [Actinidia eriantha]|uniref:30S ribosomal protein S5, chloroplastic n=1 Tax=Actinidia eriantha TaxID=165200 RepID=UPI00258F7114
QSWPLLQHLLSPPPLLSSSAPPRFSLLPAPLFLSPTPTPKTSPLSFSLSSKTLKSTPLQASPSDQTETTFYDADDLDDASVSAFDPPEAPDGFVEPPYFDDGPAESEDQITAAYEELYGAAFSGLEEDKGGESEGFVAKDGFEEMVVQVRRVTKVVKGGRQLNFRVVVVVGDKKGRVGVGVGKANEVISAVQKSALDARRNIVTVPMTKYLTFPHRSEGDYGAAKVMLRPASPGTGVIAGGSVRIVLEMAGVENALGKQLGSNNALNNARATVVAVMKMRQFSEVAAERGIPMEELWK